MPPPYTAAPAPQDQALAPTKQQQLHSSTACRNSRPPTLKTRRFPPRRNPLQQSDLLTPREHLPNRKGCQELQLRLITAVSTSMPASSCRLTPGSDLAGGEEEGPLFPLHPARCRVPQGTQANRGRPLLPSELLASQKSLCTWDTSPCLQGAGEAGCPGGRAPSPGGRVAVELGRDGGHLGQAPAPCSSRGSGQHRPAASPLPPLQPVSSDLHPKGQEK